MKLEVDENLPADVALVLRAAGHDVETVDSEGLTGAPDERVAETCRTERRALVTLDTDFGNVRAYPPSAYADLIVIRPSRQDKASVLHRVSRLLAFLETEPLDGRLWMAASSAATVGSSLIQYSSRRNVHVPVVEVRGLCEPGEPRSRLRRVDDVAHPEREHRRGLHVDVDDDELLFRDRLEPRLQLAIGALGRRKLDHGAGGSRGLGAWRVGCRRVVGGRPSLAGRPPAATSDASDPGGQAAIGHLGLVGPWRAGHGRNEVQASGGRCQSSVAAADSPRPQMRQRLSPRSWGPFNDREVLEKAMAAMAWCVTASAHTAGTDKKPWRYALIPDGDIADNMTLTWLAEKYERRP